ncbi:NADH-quinone oxidoreductase subunit NuoK [SCandidatus Aminicenantes bacterium Aminicenantia_JdfR_composite]|jgi:NADH-quinone oxidoreductase subunit K|nr:NADH-quinone oxidoreductase subunit NuoK [SCandidatus Aminicenantes bacterium Aminicenantia_JdfR_composite]MCP2620627.1 NADH-quinone oxidoreductase subunit NuoK [Candidatus Aminicenantes bacterium AC-334-E05]
MIPIGYYLILSGILFTLGIIAFFIKKDLITMFMSIEIMLNSANLAFIAFSRNLLSINGQIVVFFIITLAAAEACLGLAIILLIFRQRKTIRSEEINLMKG